MEAEKASPGAHVARLGTPQGNHNHTKGGGRQKGVARAEEAL